MSNNFYNPMAEFKPMDFSLWANPDEGSAIEDTGAKHPLAPSSTSPVLNPIAAAGPAPQASIGGISLPAPQAAPLPKQGAGGLDAKKSLDVPQDQSIFGKVHDKLRNVLTGEAPDGYDQILSPEEIMKARPSLSSSIFLGDDTPSSTGAWKAKLDKLVAQKQQEAGIVGEQRMAQRRATDLASLGPVPTDPAKYNEYVKKAYGLATARGDVRDLNAMNVPMQQILAGENDAANAKNKPAPKANTSWQTVDGPKGSNTQMRTLMNDDTGAVVRQYPITKDTTAADIARQDREQTQAYNKEQGLGDDFNKDTKTYRELGLKLQNAVSELPNALKGDGAAQTNILYSFVSAMDPQSAVREGEISLVRSAASLRAQVQQIIDKYEKTGESAMVPKPMLHQMGELMKRRLSSTRDYVNERADYYTERGKKWGVDPKVFQRLPGEGSANYQQWGITTVRKP